MSRRAVAVVIALAAAGGVPAAAQSTLPLRAYSLASAPMSAAPRAAPDPDPRLSRIAAAARATFARARRQRLAPRRRDRRSSFAAMAQAGGALDVRVRPGTDTPMLVRATAPSNGGGALYRSDEGAARAFLDTHADVFALADPEQELTLESSTSDRLGRRHLRFSQTSAGLPVWPGELLVHLDPGGNVDAVEGAYSGSPTDIPREPKIDAARALVIARAAVPDGTNAPASAPELIIYAPLRRKPRLAWRVELTIAVSARWLVVIDAITGRKRNAFNRVARDAQAGSGIDVFGMDRSLDLWEEGGLDYLVDTSKPMFDSTSDPPGADTTRGGIVILDARNQPPNDDPETIPELFPITAVAPTGPWLSDGVSAAYTLSETYDYYRERHDRNSIDGTGGTLIGVVRLGLGLQNAFWTNGLMLFGDASPYSGALDVAGHEMTHGVTEATADLIYQHQSGAANEAFSDIFGENVEARSLGSADWLKGAQLGDPIQNYTNCSSVLYLAGRAYPSRMSEYILTEDDNGGVHGNS